MPGSRPRAHTGPEPWRVRGTTREQQRLKTSECINSNISLAEARDSTAPKLSVKLLTFASPGHAQPLANSDDRCVNVIARSCCRGGEALFAKAHATCSAPDPIARIPAWLLRALGGVRSREFAPGRLQSAGDRSLPRSRDAHIIAPLSRPDSAAPGCSPTGCPPQPLGTSYGGYGRGISGRVGTGVIIRSRCDPLQLDQPCARRREIRPRGPGAPRRRGCSLEGWTLSSDSRERWG